MTAPRLLSSWPARRVGPPPDVVGQRHSRWTVVSVAEPGERGGVLVDCVCDCGSTRTMYLAEVQRGKPQSCGCLTLDVNRARMRTHGHAAKHNMSPAYRSWADMVKRCTVSTSTGFHKYGGRGIKVCSRWMSFEGFLADMGDRPAGKTLDRIDNEGNYEPGNCRWATPAEQARNTRRTRLLTIDGETLCLADWAARVGIKRQTLYRRIRLGLPPIEAVFGRQA